METLPRFTPGCLHSPVERSRVELYGRVLCGRFLIFLLPGLCGHAWTLVSQGNGRRPIAGTGLFRSVSRGPTGPISAAKQSSPATIQLAFSKNSTGGPNLISFRAVVPEGARGLRPQTIRPANASAAGTPGSGVRKPRTPLASGLGARLGSRPAAATFVLRPVSATASVPATPARGCRVLWPPDAASQRSAPARNPQAARVAENGSSIPTAPRPWICPGRSCSRDSSKAAGHWAAAAPAGWTSPS